MIFVHQIGALEKHVKRFYVDCVGVLGEYIDLALIGLCPAYPWRFSVSLPDCPSTVSIIDQSINIQYFNPCKIT